MHANALPPPLRVRPALLQVNPGKYKGLVSGMRLMIAEEGTMSVWKGWGPTLVGYSMQGFCKFGFYEVFKDLYANALGYDTFMANKGAVWLAASASAEFFADNALCPMEMVKVKVQTSPAGTWPTGFAEATAKMRAESAETRFPFGSLVPLWSRQIPYTMVGVVVNGSLALRPCVLVALQASIDMNLLEVVCIEALRFVLILWLLGCRLDTYFDIVVQLKDLPQRLLATLLVGRCQADPNAECARM